MAIIQKLGEATSRYEGSCHDPADVHVVDPAEQV